MTRRTDNNSFLRRIIRAAVTLLAVTVALSAGSSVSGANASQTGAPLAQQVFAGQADCASLSSAQFVLIGQTVMTRMLGSGAGQHLMTAHMRTVWPASGLNQAYLFMGRRLAGCAAGTGPRAFGTMMAIMGGGMMGASYGYGTKGYTTASYRPAYMMGGGSGTSSTMMGGGTGLTHPGTTRSSTVVVIGAGLVALVAVATGSVLMITRRRRVAAPHPG